ncbi:hypothetical protein GCM10010116_52270 [Microbispora rosea subsp. aerata]|nr:hypothetical protein GCM10010116_52270 [Microbispora rosea subsp. aerata]GIH58198.1 hypothetical protein Mro02_51120 [Microbispora rosea subsp. aerata]GLJ87028.1 hypothetical protein GCM10017588_57710 [Microbispora rosea subsp. aerata]
MTGRPVARRRDVPGIAAVNARIRLSDAGGDVRIRLGDAGGDAHGAASAVSGRLIGRIFHD